ncbi:MAG: substrate-binding domain-containing protein [Chthonomonadales bacterium]|nr:substrate-binding domain-containing protein [Chthonomonadales bacterium]
MISLYLDPLGRQPLYLQIVDQIESAVCSQTLAEGHTLWSARKIAAHYHIAYQTANRALAELARRGVVRRSVAGGTVVARRGGDGRARPRSRVVALISCWAVWQDAPTYTMAEMQMSQAAAHALTAEMWGVLAVTMGSGDVPGGFSVARLADWARQARFDGAIVFGNMPERGLRWLADHQYPVVVVDHEPAAPFARVVHDSYGGMRAAMGHLLGLGHRSIAFLRGLRPYHYDVRQRAYEDALAEAGIAGDPQLVCCARRPHPTVADILDLWLDLPVGRRPTAIAAASDIVAALVAKELRARGLRVPGSMSLTGYDDEPFAPLLDPPLTTLRVSWSEMGQRAADLALAELVQEERGARNGHTPDPTRVVVMPELVERLSTCPALTLAAPGRHDAGS